MRDFDVVAVEQDESRKPISAEPEFDVLFIAKRNLDGFQQVVAHWLVIFLKDNSLLR